MKSFFAHLSSKVFLVLVFALALNVAAASDSPPPPAPPPIGSEVSNPNAPFAPPANPNINLAAPPAMPGNAPMQIAPTPPPPSGSAPAGMMVPRPMPYNPSYNQAPPSPPLGGPVPQPVVNEPITPATVTPLPPAVKAQDSIKEKTKKKSSKSLAKAKAAARGIPASMRRGHHPGEVGGTKNFAETQRALHNLFPNENVGLEMVSNGIAVTGLVSDLETAHRIVEVVGQYIPKSSHVINMMQIKTNQQVMLRVRIGEIKRTAAKGFGLLTLNALEHDGLFKTLAEPNLVAISGETANFLSGGEFPVPVAGDQGTTVQYKNYGIGLQFTPIVLSQNRIRLTVESEVSDLSSKGEVKTEGFSIPSLTERKARTTVELAPGESYMIAGLLKDNMTVKTGNITGLGDIPVLGALFRDSDTDHNETELIIAVTPYLVDPVKSKDIRLPSDDYHTPSQMETIFFGALGSMDDSDKVQLQNPKAAVPGGFGFMTE